MLQHEGSSPPQDPRKPSDPSRILVLDISGPSAAQSDDFVPLMLRRPDPRRWDAIGEIDYYTQSIFISDLFPHSVPYIFSCPSHLLHGPHIFDNIIVN